MALIFHPHGNVSFDKIIDKTTNTQPFELSRKTREDSHWHTFSISAEYFAAAGKYLSQLILLVIAPTVAAIALALNQVLVIFINMVLAVASLAKFVSEVYQGRVSWTDLALTMLLLTAALVAAFFLFSNPLGWTTAALIATANLVATAINMTFIIEKLVVPQFAKFIHWVARQCGYEQDVIHSVTLDIKNRDKDRFNQLVAHENATNIDNNKIYNTDANVANGYRDTLAKRFRYDQLLSYLRTHERKLQDLPFGSIRREADIGRLQNNFNQITLEANPTSARDFVRMKLLRKKSKIQDLERLKTSVSNFPKQYQQEIVNTFNTIDPMLCDNGTTAFDELTPARQETALANRFSGCVSRRTAWGCCSCLFGQPVISDQSPINSIINQIDNEIAKQGAKLEKLQSCLPLDDSNPSTIDQSTALIL